MRRLPQEDQHVSFGHSYVDRAPDSSLTARFSVGSCNRNDLTTEKKYLIIVTEFRRRQPWSARPLMKDCRPYQIGPKLRALRLKKSMGLVELGKHTGLSAALLSKLERDKLYPTLPTLLRIAMVFSVGLDYFFTDERKRHVVSVVRKHERIRLPERPGASESRVPFREPGLQGQRTENQRLPGRFRTDCRRKAEISSAPGFGIPARAERHLGTEDWLEQYELQAGDSMYFDSNVPHTYRR